MQTDVKLLLCAYAENAEGGHTANRQITPNPCQEKLVYLSPCSILDGTKSARLTTASRYARPQYPYRSFRRQNRSVQPEFKQCSRGTALLENKKPFICASI